MISRRIKCSPENDDYRRLANYIADASAHTFFSAICIAVSVIFYLN